jgi:uncharacterized protein (DUF2249 family)/uncharacterized protein YjiS (DUF1127 family)
VFRQLWGAISCRLNAFVEGVAEARRMARAYDELAKMSEPELRDIGISRGDIPAVFSRTYRAPHSIFDPASSARQEKVAIAGPQRSTRRPRSQYMADAVTPSKSNVVDVRSLVPAQRHAKIFQLVNELTPGASFILVNDHDPKPLYYQLEAEYPKQFSWTYRERGPEVWRVEIGKLAQAA